MAQPKEGKLKKVSQKTSLKRLAQRGGPREGRQRGEPKEVSPERFANQVW